LPEYWIRRAITVLITPVGLALISAVRLLIISNYNVTTATTVAESGGYVNTFLGSLIPLVPVFMPYLALVLLAARRFILCAMAVAATALISPVFRPQQAALRSFDDYWIRVFHWTSLHLFYVAAIVFGVWVFSLMVPWHRLYGHWVYRMLGAAWACVVIFALIPYLLNAYPAPRTQAFYASYLRQPWLSAEQITVKENKVYQGYVLASDDQWMTVLLFQSRTIAYFRAESVIKRMDCQSGVNPRPPLDRLLIAENSGLPKCRVGDSWTVARHSTHAPAVKPRNKPKKRPRASSRFRVPVPPQLRYPGWPASI
jgi:hypothetical protein